MRRSPRQRIRIEVSAETLYDQMAFGATGDRGVRAEQLADALADCRSRVAIEEPAAER